MPGTSARRHLRQPSPTSRRASKHARQTRIERPKSALTHAIIVKGGVLSPGTETLSNTGEHRTVDELPRLPGGYIGNLRSRENLRHASNRGAIRPWSNLRVTSVDLGSDGRRRLRAGEPQTTAE